MEPSIERFFQGRLSMFSDERGLILTTSCAEAAQEFNMAMRCYHDYKLSLGKHLKAALAADAQFGLAHVMKGYTMMMFGTVETLPSAQKSLAAAEAVSEQLSERERLHIEALRAWIAGNLHASNAQLQRILDAHPQDLLALRLLHFSSFWLGEKGNMLKNAQHAYEQWDSQTPGYAHVLGMYAFGLEENGEYARAEPLGRKAVELHPEDAWATHAVAHVLEMQGRHQEGIDWLEGTKSHWREINPFRIHLWWHRCLFHLELDQYDRVLELYDTELRGEQSDFYSDLQNAVALLWRLKLRGVALGTRWEELADKCAQRMEDHGFPYNESHYVMALVAAGRLESARQMVARRRAFSDVVNAAGSSGVAITAASLFDQVYLPACEAVIAYGEGRHDESAAQLASLADTLVRGGGSDVQRDIFSQTMIAAAIQGRQWLFARELLVKRIRERPTSREAWRQYITVLETLEDIPAADQARAALSAL